METKTRLHEIKPPNSLIVKLPEEKDPVICLCFSNEFEAQKTNADLFEKWKHETYQVTLMPNKFGQAVLIDLLLVSPNNQRMYKGLAFDYGKLNWWLSFVKNYKSTKIKFCHVFKKVDEAILVKSYNTHKWAVLNVSNLVVHDLMELN